MSLQDQHLQQALKNAPDKDMAPNDVTRAAVLTYANKAVKPHHEKWLNAIFDMWREWFGGNWYLTGIGSAVATVLVVVVFWHEMPDETIRQAAMPSETAVTSMTDGTADSAKEKTVEVASADIPLEKDLSGNVTLKQEASKDIVEYKAAASATPSTAKATSPAISADREIETNVAPISPKNSGLAEITLDATDQLTKKSEMPAAVAVMQDKVVVADTADSIEATVKGDLAKNSQAESDAELRMRKQDNVVRKSTSIVELGSKEKSMATSPAKLGAAMPKVLSTQQENHSILARIKNEGGKAIANQDIQASKLRILKVELQILESLDCAPSAAQAQVIDAITGYEIKFVGDCEYSASVLREIEIYNQIMRDWQRNHVR